MPIKYTYKYVSLQPIGVTLSPTVCRFYYYLFTLLLIILSLSPTFVIYFVSEPIIHFGSKTIFLSAQSIWCILYQSLFYLLDWGILCILVQSIFYSSSWSLLSILAQRLIFISVQRILFLLAQRLFCINYLWDFPFLPRFMMLAPGLTSNLYMVSFINTYNNM